MEYIALYRKYRPKNFNDVCGQDVIVKILRNSIVNSKIGHAYLFAGARGTGKTSIAKIFAKAVNCLQNKSGDSCNECKMCKVLEKNDVDIIEIDAASNNGVDEIREIRNNTKLVPAIAKYKVYIIDEVHMLSTGAFNALLKTLEEPPEHVIFILATTEAQKIPLTILSRCQRYDFKKIPEKILLKRLEYILKKEEKKVDEKILKLVCELGDGSFRDAINLLDQIIDLNEITEEFLYKISGGINDQEIISFLELVVNGKTKESLDKINEFVLNGVNFTTISEKLLILLRNISINNTVHNYFDQEYTQKIEKFSIDTDVIQTITKKLIDLISELKKSTNQKITFDIYIINIINVIHKETSGNVSKQAAEKNIQPEHIELIPPQNKDQDDELKKIRINNALATADKTLLNEINDRTKKLDDYISNKKYNTIAKALLESKIVCSGEKYLIIVSPSISMINLLNEEQTKTEKLLEIVLEKSYKMVVISSDEWEETKKTFIKNKKNNIKYEIIPEKNVKIKKAETSGVENEAIELFGEDNITVK